MMNGCDTLFMVGSSFPYAEFLPKEGRARGVQLGVMWKALLGPLGVRVYCEILIIFFRINETLTEIKHAMGQRPPEA